MRCNHYTFVIYLGTSEYDYLSTIGYYFGDVYVVTLRHAPVSHYYGGLRREVNGFKDAKKVSPHSNTSLV